MPLHMTKIAYASKTLDSLRRWVEAGDEAQITTRYAPRRHAEMVGGSLYWIIDHTLVARCEILGFGQSGDGRCQIRLAPELVLVDPRPRRAHQGWRYLADADAPPDLASGEAAGDVLPGRLFGRLAKLGLV